MLRNIRMILRPLRASHYRCADVKGCQVVRWVPMRLTWEVLSRVATSRALLFVVSKHRACTTSVDLRIISNILRSNALTSFLVGRS